MVPKFKPGLIDEWIKEAEAKGYADGVAKASACIENIRADVVSAFQDLSERFAKAFDAVERPYVIQFADGGSVEVAGKRRKWKCKEDRTEPQKTIEFDESHVCAAKNVTPCNNYGKTHLKRGLCNKHYANVKAFKKKNNYGNNDSEWKAGITNWIAKQPRNTTEAGHASQKRWKNSRKNSRKSKAKKREPILTRLDTVGCALANASSECNNYNARGFDNGMCHKHATRVRWHVKKRSLTFAAAIKFVRDTIVAEGKKP